VANTDEGERITREALSNAGIQTRDFKAGDPTLENAFVAKLREFGGELKTIPFPSRRKFRERAADALAIKAEDLCKRFGGFNAVKNINLEVKYGEIYGLLGANGAGKTTTIKMLCGASSGKMALAGESGRLRSSFVRQRIGY